MCIVGLSIRDRTPSMGVPLADELRIVSKALWRSEPHGIVLGPKSARLGVAKRGHARLGAQSGSGKRHDTARLGNDSFGSFDHGDESDPAASGTDTCAGSR